MLIVLAGVLGILFYLRLFSPSVNQTCVFPAEVSCLSTIFYSSNSVLMINLQQATTSPITVTAIGCNNQSKYTNMIPESQSIAIGGNYTFGVTCYGGGGVVASIVPGQIYSGYVLVNYTDSATSFPHSVIGTVVAKAV